MGADLSAQQLRILDLERALRPRGRYRELAVDHVSFDRLAGAPCVDGCLRRSLAGDPSVTTVIGATGAGKSGTIAACTAALDARYTTVRVPIGGLGQQVTDPVAVGQHILREVTRRASKLLRRRHRDALELASADVAVHGRGGLRAGMTVGLGSALLSRQVSADIAGARLDRETRANPAAIAAGLERLAGIFAARGRRLILVFEDTDTWPASYRDAADEVADRFLAEVTAPLARDLELHVIVAVDPRWTARPGYRAVRDRLGAEVIIPLLERPSEAIRTILQRRLDASAIRGARVDDVFTTEAVVRLEAEYDHTRGNLRRVLALCDAALRRSGPSHPERLSEHHVRAAGVHACG
jgi:Cdc6-like AAA superfamily ATPase